MPNAHRGIRNRGLSNAPYQLPSDSPARAVPNSANNTHTATATSNGPILSVRTSDLHVRLNTIVLFGVADHAGAACAPTERPILASRTSQAVHHPASTASSPDSP